jgi:hypothetical protein
MEVRVSGRAMDTRDVQPAKAESPREVRESGRAMTVRDVQREKACNPI